jgi:hypothetical protein
MRDVDDREVFLGFQDFGRKPMRFAQRKLRIDDEHVLFAGDHCRVHIVSIHSTSGVNGQSGVCFAQRKSLEGNFEGDSAARDVFVYLPPSYACDTTRRYPVAYFLHGYGVDAEAYVRC